MEFAFTGTLFFISLHWGPVGVATSWSISLCSLTLPALWYAGRPMNLSIGPMVAVIWKFIVASIAAAYATALIAKAMPSFSLMSGILGAIERMVETSLLFTVLYLAAVVLLHRGFGPIIQIVNLMREMIPARRSRRIEPEPSPVA
jgi:hypothetical protein